jgi:hypothetical protein
MHGIEECYRDRRLPVTRTHEEHQRRVACAAGIHSPSGFTNPTGPVKPPPSGSGLPDRFDQKPVEIG